jgi:hypothetical protein
LISDSIEQILNVAATGGDRCEQIHQSLGICFGQAGEGIEQEHQLFGLGFIKVGDQHRDPHVGCGLSTQMTIDQQKPAVRQFTRHQRVGEANLRKDPAQRVSLSLRMPSPILRIG